MKISLGILAYNEEENIEQTLRDILKQDVWAQPEFTGEIHVVVNGSSDRTAERARTLFAGTSEGPVRIVHELTRAGKANAWNEFTHRLSAEDSQFLIFADADIRIPATDALKCMVETLKASPGAAACVDVPRKDFSRVSMSSVMRKISGSASTLAASGPPKLCGQLYVARAELLRSFVLPDPLLVEDGLIKAMLVTRNFSGDENPEHLVRADGVYHLYEPETGLAAFYRHEKRILIGSLCNFMLFRRLREIADTGGDAGEWLRRQNEKDPGWFQKELELYFSKTSYRSELWTLTAAPMNSLKHMHGVSKIKAFPVALLRFMLTSWVGLGTARDLKKRKFVW